MLNDDVVVKVNKDNMIPTLLNLIKQEYLKGRAGTDDPIAAKKQLEAQYAIEEAIFSWIDEMKEEKAKKEMMEKIRRRFDAKWSSW